MRWVRDSGVLARRLLIALGVILVGGSVLIVVTRGGPVLPGSGTCTVTVGSTQTKISSVQAENAAIIVAVAVRRGLSERAATIALATAMQESKLVNLDHGDRDSLGLFQQRPSQGWGTAEQILDPVHSSQAFYHALRKVPGWKQMSLTEAAQAVQRSAFPEAYAAHEEAAQAVASALIGSSPHALTCSIRGGTSGFDIASALSGIQQDVSAGFGEVVSISRSGDALMIRSERGRPRSHSWAVASYLVARARVLGIGRVEVGNHLWERETGTWRQASRQDPGTVTVSPV